MKRTQIQLEEATYEILRRRAFEQGVSMAALLREALVDYLGVKPEKRRSLREFGFVGSGESKQSELAPVSERHDEALTEDFA